MSPLDEPFTQRNQPELDWHNFALYGGIVLHRLTAYLRGDSDAPMLMGEKVHHIVNTKRRVRA